MIIKVDSLRKSFNQVPVLKDVSFDMEEGQVLAVIGPSGGGKSTLLRCINFLEAPDAGSILFKDRKIDVKNAKKEDIAWLRRHSAMVFQQFNLFRYKTALENVMEGLMMVQKKSKSEAKDIATDFLQQVGLEDHKDFYPRQLSGGQKQRVGIARALALHPDVILLDEPTSALDPEMIGEVLDVIRKARELGHTMIIVSHEMGFVSEIADKVLFLDDGRITESGTPDAIFNHPQMERTRQFLARVSVSTTQKVYGQ